MMTAGYRRPWTRIIPPAPPEFAKEFVRGGWRRVERIYGARTDLLLKWIEMNGGDDLHRQRRDFLAGHSVTAVSSGDVRG